VQSMLVEQHNGRLELPQLDSQQSTFFGLLEQASMSRVPAKETSGFISPLYTRNVTRSASSHWSADLRQQRIAAGKSFGTSGLKESPASGISLGSKSEGGE
jgi:hypothetical protein